MIIPHNFRPTTLKLRWASNFAKLPQNSRNISRKFLNYHLWLRLTATFIIFGLLTIIITKSHYQTSPEQSKLTKPLTRKSASANPHVIYASRLINEFNQSQNPQKLNLAREELQIALIINPKNSFAQKQLLTVNKLETPNIQEEISKTQEILKNRPDYSAAWLRLSVLYDQLGENNLAREAKENAQKLNPDLELPCFFASS